MQAVTFNTNGLGYWSRTAKAVEIVDMRVNYVNDEKDFGELCVYFNTEYTETRVIFPSATSKKPPAGRL